MCTAISFHPDSHCFGRTLDLEQDCIGTIVITPRNYPLPFRRLPERKTHLAIIGMAAVSQGYPLYYDAMNEVGLCAAGLLFAGSAHYLPESPEKTNVSPFELIPFLLSQCATAAQARAMLANVNLAAIPFSDALPLSPMHWMISDGRESIVVEPTVQGLSIHDNPIHVLTNNPSFEDQLTNLTQYMQLSPHAPRNTLFPDADLTLFSRGMGAIGLPGDWSSPSRFVRAAYIRATSLCGNSDEDAIRQFFHMLSAVHHVRGSVMVDGKPEITQYASCMHAKSGVYYYTTYDRSIITGVDMRRENLDDAQLIEYPVLRSAPPVIQNA